MASEDAAGGTERGDEAGEAARKALLEVTAELCLRAEAARSRRDPEGVHKMRVSSRRLAAVLDVWRAAFPDRARWAAAKAALRDLRRVLGGVRDLDVHRETLAAVRDEVPRAAGVVEALLSELSARRDGAEAALDQLLDDFDRQVVARLAALAATARGHERADRAARRRLTRRFGRMRRALEIAADRAPATLHAARKEAKKLRYLFEVTGGDAAIAALKSLQDALGEIHDLDVLAAELAPFQDGGDGGDGKLAPSARAMADHVDAQRAACVEKLAGTLADERIAAIEEAARHG